MDLKGSGASESELEDRDGSKHEAPNRGKGKDAVFALAHSYIKATATLRKNGWLYTVRACGTHHLEDVKHIDGGGIQQGVPNTHTCDRRVLYCATVRRGSHRAGAYASVHVYLHLAESNFYASYDDGICISFTSLSYLYPAARLLFGCGAHAVDRSKK